MDKLSHVSRPIEAAPGFEQLPHDVMQHVLHYLPIKRARNVFKLTAKGYLASTEYLRNAGLVQARIRDKAATGLQQLAASRMASLISDCMDPSFPAELRYSLFMDLIDTLPQLPVEAHADAMRAVLAQCDTVGTHAGEAGRRKCMTRCIHAYQRRTGLEPKLQKFTPASDEEACIAADYFAVDMEHAAVPFLQLVCHLRNLLAAMDWADAMDDSEQGGGVITKLCDHATSLFAALDGDAASLRKNAEWGQVASLKAQFAAKATLLFPARSMSCQVALISVILDLSEQGSAMRKRAEKDGRSLIAKTPDDVLSANLVPLATHLFRKGVINTLIKRVEAWPEPATRLGMLRQLAVVAWERGAMDHMEHLCAVICKLVPPDPVALQALMQANMQKQGLTRMEIATREVIPYLLCVPPGLPRVAAIETLGIFLLVFPALNTGTKALLRATELLTYSVRGQSKLMSIYYSSNEAQLERLAAAAKPADRRPAAAGTASSTAVPPTNPTYEAAMNMLEQFRKQNAKTGD